MYTMGLERSLHRCICASKLPSINGSGETMRNLLEQMCPTPCIVNERERRGRTVGGGHGYFSSAEGMEEERNTDTYTT